MKVSALRPNGEHEDQSTCGDEKQGQSADTMPPAAAPGESSGKCTDGAAAKCRGHVKRVQRGSAQPTMVLAGSGTK
jgi:hypothetical protein